MISSGIRGPVAGAGIAAVMCLFIPYDLVTLCVRPSLVPTALNTCCNLRGLQSIHVSFKLDTAS